MSLHTILLSVAAVGFTLILFLWELGADRMLSHIGSFMIRVLTMNRVRIPADRIDNTAELSVGAATLILAFVLFAFISSLLG